MLNNKVNVLSRNNLILLYSILLETILILSYTERQHTDKVNHFSILQPMQISLLQNL